MPEPYNYSAQLSPLPTTALMGMQSGLIPMALQAQQFRAQQQQQAAMQRDIAEVSQNPTPEAISGLMLRYPALSEHFKQAHESVSADQQKSLVDQGSQVQTALVTGHTDTAIELLTKLSEGYKNKGDLGRSKVMADLAESAKTDPKLAIMGIGSFLSYAMGPEKYAENFNKLGAETRASELHPAELKAAEAKAEKAAVESKFAESKAAQDLEKGGWDIKKIQNDIDVSKQNAKIAMMNAQIARETNGLKRQELGLKLQEMQDKRDEVIRTKAADASDALAAIDNSYSTIQQALNFDLKTIEMATGKFAGRVGGATALVDSDVNNFRKIIDTIKGQQFMQAYKNLRGGGQITAIEGEKATTAIGNLDLSQDTQTIISNLKELQRIIQKGRKNVILRYGVPGTDIDLRPGVEEPIVRRER